METHRGGHAIHHSFTLAITRRDLLGVERGAMEARDSAGEGPTPERRLRHRCSRTK